jgi:hypothetical protein
MPAGADLLSRTGHCRRARAASLVAGTLTIEPRVDVPLAEPPLAADSDGWNLPGLDKAIHRTEIDLKVFKDLFRGQEDFVVRKVQRQYDSL